MKISLARWASIAGHPFVLLSFLVLRLHSRDDPQGALRALGAFALIVLLPLGLLVWRSRATGRWRTVDASDKADRPVLYLVIGLVLVAAGVYASVVERSPASVRACGVIGAMMGFAWALNRWIKLSLHVACAAFCGVLLAGEHFRAGWLILALVPVLMWSRLALSRHVLFETVGGLILGGVGGGCLFWL